MELKDFVGTDKSIAISLFEYGVIVSPSTYRKKDNAPDEWFCIYSVGNDTFDAGYIREKELDAIIKGEGWASKNDIESFLSWLGTTKEQWLKTDFVHKIQECIQYWGYQNIMGSSYENTITKEELLEQYELLR